MVNHKRSKKHARLIGVAVVPVMMLLAALQAGCGGMQPAPVAAPAPNGGGGGNGGGQPTQALAGSGARTQFQIQNVSSETICYVHISPTSSSTWGPDRLGASEVVATNVRRGWTLPVGSYDIQLQDCQHGTLMERRNVSIGGSGITITFRVRE